MLMLYPATSLNSFIVLINYIIGFSVSFQVQYTIISSANINIFTSLHILIPLIALSCLIAWVNTSHTMLNSGGQGTFLSCFPS